MATVVWPPATPAADSLLIADLDRAAPGWTLQATREMSGREVAEALWTFLAPLTGRPPPTVEALAEIEFDRALEEVAAGREFDPASLSTAAMDVFHARITVALAAAMVADAEGSQVMRLPQGLSDQARARAVLLRLLYQAPLSIEGLR